MSNVSVAILSLAGAAAVLMAALVLLGKVPLRYNFRNLTVRWKTTAMTALAFTMVIALLTVMLAFVNAMYRLTQASGHAENVILLSDGATDEVFSTLKPTDLGDVDYQPGIARGPEGRPLASREIYVIVNQPIPDAPPGRPKRRLLQIRGIEDPQVAAMVHGLSLYPGGKWFSAAGVRELPSAPPGSLSEPPGPLSEPPGSLSEPPGSLSEPPGSLSEPPGLSRRLGGAAPTPLSTNSSRRPAIQVVLGEGIAREMGRWRTAAQAAAARNPQRLDVGDRFELDSRTWLVVGVMQSAGSTFDSEVWAKSGMIGPMFGKETYTSVVVRANSAATAVKLKDYFTNRYKRAAMQAQVETDYFAALSGTSQQFLYGIMVVAAIMAVGGVFGVMNTMLAAISQRTADIGVLRLLGYNRRQVLISFLLESLLIALVGGGLGCALGCLTDGWSAASVVANGPGGGKFVVLKLIVDARIITSGLLLTLLMGILGGLLPAVWAVRLKPLEALR